MSVFNDPLVECLNCHKRNRADKLEESYAEKHGDKMPENGMKTSSARTAAPVASGPNRATST